MDLILLSMHALSCPIRGKRSRVLGEGAQISLDAIDCHYKRVWDSLEQRTRSTEKRFNDRLCASLRDAANFSGRDFPGFSLRFTLGYCHVLPPRE